MAEKKYVRVTRGLVDKGQLVPYDEYMNYIDPDSDYYVSTYYYNEAHFNKFKTTRSVKGITDVTTDRFYLDFDSTNPDLARIDAIEAINRLKGYGIKENNIEIFYSGSKGYHVVVQLNKLLDPQSIKAIAVSKFGKDLKTFDSSLYDANQIIRVPYTPHQVTGLYKTPLTVKQITMMSTDAIKELSKDFDKLPDSTPAEPVAPTSSFYELSKEEPLPKKEVTPISMSIDLSDRPRHFQEWKWAIAKGYFESGERNNALTVLAATLRGLGYDQQQAVAFCKTAIDKQASRTNTKPFSLSELESGPIASVYSDGWQGGTFSPKNDPWLQKFCDRLGIKWEEDKNRAVTIPLTEAFNMFESYASNIDDLTIKTGISSLDKNLRMTVGMSVGILASPGAGKTSLALNILNNVSKSGLTSIFFSYDMFHALVTQKLIQKHMGMNEDQIFDLYKNKNQETIDKIKEVLGKEYSNVHFCFESGQSLEQIERTIKNVEDTTGNKVKLIVVDYTELVMTDMSDGTAASAVVAQGIRKIANVNQLCAISLLQPNKASGAPNEEIRSYLSIKGSGTIQQAMSVIIGLSRPGFDPTTPADDRFINMNCLKNRMGKLFSLDFHWDGQSGTIRDMTSEEARHLKEIKEKKKEAEAEKKSEGGWS